MRYGSLSSLIGVVLAGAFLGCASQSDSKPETTEEPVASEANQPYERFEVTVSHAPFYYFSPAQSTGPDRGLQKGETVEMVQKERGFSRVRTAAGREGYVANDQITPLPPEPALSLAPDSGNSNIGIAPNPDSPGRLQIVPLDQMLPPVEPPLPSTGAPTPSPTPTP